MIQPLIKWTGSKRHLSDIIIDNFPTTINTYYEPFVGGGSILINLLNRNHNIKKIIASDINKDLIGIYQILLSDSKLLYEKYESMWSLINSKRNTLYQKEIYNNFRIEYNNTNDPCIFLFLTRTCYNGMVRYNKNGKFNSPFHINRRGILPSKMKNIIETWKDILLRYEVEFIHSSYDEIISNTDIDDYVYMDPPYITTNSIYLSQFDIDEFYMNLRKIKSKYSFSHNGKVNNIHINKLPPTDVYSSHIYMPKFNSSFARLKNKENKVSESLYLSYVVPPFKDTIPVII